MFKGLKKTLYILLLLTFIGAILRFSNLNWGAPYYFHPDERNIASSVSQLNFPDQMNPHFFAYGSLPIYTIYFSGIIANSIQCSMSNSQCQIANVTFEEAIVISRFYSALFSVLLIPLLFVIASKLTANRQPPTAALFAAFLAATSVGFIQFAHFGTFEMWLTFFGTLIFWLCLRKMTENNVFLMGIVFGALMATKVSSLALLPLPLLAMIANNIRKKNPKSEARNPKQSQNTNHQNSKRFGFIIFGHLNLFRYSNFDIRILALLKKFILFLLLSACVYTVTNPYVFWDTKSFESSMKYESSVALGTLPVFYTGEFYNAIPGLFHFLYVYPFLLNPLITLLFIPTCIYIVYKGFKTKDASLLVLASFFFITFLSQIFLFVKWTRYMVPTLPFVYLIVAIAANDLFKLSFRATTGSRGIFSTQAALVKRSLHAAYALVGMTSLIFSISYFITAFIQPDTRIAAKQFAQDRIPPNAPILSEVYDLGIIAFNNDFEQIDLFNFYDLDPASPGNPVLAAEMHTKIKDSQYIILPSQRLLKIRINNPEKFPNGSFFYNSLITDKLGYERIYETPCDIFCKITYLGDPVFRYEETANVFDRPTVFIFRRK